MYIFFDLDDTLLTKKKEITPFTKEILNKCRNLGHKLVINTARGFLATKSIIEELNPDFSVLNAGALVIDRDLNQVYKSPITEDLDKIILDIYSCSEKVMIQTIDILYSSNENDVTETTKYIDVNDVNLNEFFKGGAYKIVPRKIDLDKAYKIKDKYNLDFCIYGSGTWTRFCKYGTTKAKGMKVVIQYDGGSIEDTISFGDDYGDLEMLLESKIGVAMANSVLEVKEKAKYHTCSNEEDGVAEFLKKYFNL